MSIVMEHERVGEGWVPVLSWSILLSILNFVTIRNIIMSMNYQIFLNWGDASAITWSSSSSNNLRNAVDLFYASCWACCACWVWFDCFFVGIVTGNGCCCCCCWCSSLADCGYWNWFWFWFWGSLSKFWSSLGGPIEGRFWDWGCMTGMVGVNFYTNLYWLWRCGCSDC